MKTQSDMDLIIRLDKWLWAARFYKTRAIARKMIEGGKVHYNGQRSKPSKVVEKHAIIKLRQGNDELTIEILAISDGAHQKQERYIMKHKTVLLIEKDWL